jgi:hypothetical protein
MSRAATTEELAIYRSEGLAEKLYAIIDQPVTVYQCQVDQVFETHDKIAEVSYTSATGTLADALPGMTVLVGSTAGAHDKGLARLRKTWSESIAYLGEMSEIDWETGLYLTVIDAFSIWPRHLLVSAGDVWMDYDVAYSDQNSNFSPIPCLGPDRVLKLAGDDVTSQLSAEASWVPGSTISAYAWSVVRGTGASLDDNDIATPTLTATATGRILISCTVTAANGKSSTAYRNVYVWDQESPPDEIILNGLAGSYERGGFEFSFELPISPGFTPRDFTKVVLFAEDVPLSIGSIAGAENVLAVGWMDERECAVNDQAGTASIGVKGAHYWLSKMQGFPTGIENASGTPTRWTQIQSLTIDKMLAHFITWRTTLSNCCDFFATADTRVAPALKAPVGNLWQQIKVLADDSILAAPMCDPYSRLFVQIDGNILPVADRTGTPTIIELTKDDYGRVGFSRRGPDVSLVDVSGVNGSGTPFLAISPGNVWGKLGTPFIKDKLLIDSQAQALSLAGLIFGREKREIENIEINLVSAIRLVTLAPRQYMGLDVEAGDTPAGIAYSGKVLPREVTIEHDATTGTLNMNVTAEPETFPGPAVKKEPPNNPGIELSPFPPLPPDPPEPPDPLPAPDTTNLQVRAVVLHCWGGLYVTYNINDVEPTWVSLNENIKLDDSLSPRLLHQIGAHRFDKTLVACSLFGVYVATIGVTPGQLYKVFDLGYVDSYCPRGAAAGENVIYGCGVDAVSGAIFVWAGNNRYYRSNAVPAEYPETIMIRSLDGGASWTRLRPKSFGLSPGDIDRFWGFDYLRNITVADGIPIAQSSNTGNSETSFQQMLLNGISTDNLYRFSRDTDAFEFGNHIHHRIGYSKDLIYYRVPAAGSVLRKFILGPDLESSLSWSTDEVPVADIAMSGNPNVYLRDARNMLGIDPLGESCLIAGYDGYFWRSVDRGDHWTQDVLIPNDGTPPNYTADGLGRNPCLVSPSPGVWIAAANRIGFVGATNLKYGKVMLSEDNGANWYDKTGNLYDIGAADTTPSGSNSGLSAYNIEVFYGDPEGAPE